MAKAKTKKVTQKTVNKTPTIPANLNPTQNKTLSGSNPYPDINNYEWSQNIAEDIDNLYNFWQFTNPKQTKPPKVEDLIQNYANFVKGQNSGALSGKIPSITSLMGSYEDFVNQNPDLISGTTQDPKDAIWHLVGMKTSGGQSPNTGAISGSASGSQPFLNPANMPSQPPWGDWVFGGSGNPPGAYLSSYSRTFPYYDQDAQNWNKLASGAYNEWLQSNERQLDYWNKLNEIQERARASITGNPLGSKGLQAAWLGEGRGHYGGAIPTVLPPAPPEFKQPPDLFKNTFRELQESRSFVYPAVEKEVPAGTGGDKEKAFSIVNLTGDSNVTLNGSNNMRSAASKINNSRIGQSPSSKLYNMLGTNFDQLTKNQFTFFTTNPSGERDKVIKSNKTFFSTFGNLDNQNNLTVDIGNNRRFTVQIDPTKNVTQNMSALIEAYWQNDPAFRNEVLTQLQTWESNVNKQLKQKGKQIKIDYNQPTLKGLMSKAFQQYGVNAPQLNQSNQDEAGDQLFAVFGDALGKKIRDFAKPRKNQLEWFKESVNSIKAHPKTWNDAYGQNPDRFLDDVSYYLGYNFAYSHLWGL